jgi:hypothetical protein
MLKDLGLATEAARQAHQPVVLGAVAQQLYQAMSLRGEGGKDFSAIINSYRKPQINTGGCKPGARVGRARRGFLRGVTQANTKYLRTVSTTSHVPFMPGSTTKISPAPQVDRLLALGRDDAVALTGNGSIPTSHTPHTTCRACKSRCP